MRPHNWMATHWKPASAFIYTLICLFDFVIFPTYLGLNKVDMVQLIGHIQHLEPVVQQQVMLASTVGYEPFTLRGSGLFHLAFGALLTGAALHNGAAPSVSTRDPSPRVPSQTPPPAADTHGYQPREGSDPGKPPKED